MVAIHWTGGETQLMAAKERHKSGDVCIVEPLTGRFVAHIREQADRLYVADVAGDWREEILVVNGNELHIYQNPEKNPRPDLPRLWDQQHYRRNKMYGHGKKQRSSSPNFARRSTDLPRSMAACHDPRHRLPMATNALPVPAMPSVQVSYPGRHWA